MEVVATSETSFNFNLTIWRYIPQDSELHSRNRENLKYHRVVTAFVLEGLSWLQGN
jgi:hypothetical protein